MSFGDEMCYVVFSQLEVVSSQGPFASSYRASTVSRYRRWGTSRRNIGTRANVKVLRSKM